MFQFLLELKWDFITVVYSDDNIGRESYRTFRRLAPSYYMCIDKSIAVSPTGTVSDVNTHGVVYLGSEGIGR